MPKVLTQELIRVKTKTDNLQAIKNLNLWGNEIEDVQILQEMPQVEVLSLSVNKISSLKEFSNCYKLQELYLRKNAIEDLSEIRYLSDLPELRVLWLSDNPCAEVENYREIVIKCLPELQKLDNIQITPEERLRAESKDLRFPTKEVKRATKNTIPEVNRVKKVTRTNDENLSYETPSKWSSRRNTETTGSRKKESYEEAPLRTKYDSKYQVEQAVNERDYPAFSSQSRRDKVSTSDQQKDNVMCAIMTLMKTLDITDLEILRSTIDKRIDTLQQDYE